MSRLLVVKSLITEMLETRDRQIRVCNVCFDCPICMLSSSPVARVFASTRRPNPVWHVYHRHAATRDVFNLILLAGARRTNNTLRRGAHKCESMMWVLSLWVHEVSLFWFIQCLLLIVVVFFSFIIWLTVVSINYVYLELLMLYNCILHLSVGAYTCYALGGFFPLWT